MPTADARHAGWATSPMGARSVGQTIAVPALSRAASGTQPQKPRVTAIRPSAARA